MTNADTGLGTAPGRSMPPREDGRSSGGPAAPVPATADRTAVAREFGAALGVEVLEELGRGARTAVFRIRRDGTGPCPALKVAVGPVADADELEAAFRREAVLLAGVDHPRVARIQEVGRVGGRPYLVMDLVEGRTLRVLQAAGPMPWARVAQLGEDVAGMLAVAHRRDLVLRDAKPQNIVVTADGEGVLIDFGLLSRARVPQDEADQAVAGTFTYCAPEQSGYLVARVGASPECARTYGGVGYLLRMSWLDRLAQAAFRRSTRVAREVGDLRLVAQVAWHDAIAWYLRGADDGERLARVAAERRGWRRPWVRVDVWGGTGRGVRDAPGVPAGDRPRRGGCGPGPDRGEADPHPERGSGAGVPQRGPGLMDAGRRPGPAARSC